MVPSRNGENNKLHNQILVTYAAKYGATAEIAEKIGQVLEQASFSVDVQPVEKVYDLTRYQVVVIGSAVYAGIWRKDAVEFLEENEKHLAELPVWIFSSGPTGQGDPVELMKRWKFPEAQQPIANRIKPREIVVFHGDLDAKKLNFAEKMIVKGVKAPLGDYRDWDVIES